MPETAKRTARVPILGEDGRISDDYIPAAIGEGVESAEAAAKRAETAATDAEGSATAASQSATQAASSASVASARASQAQESATTARGAVTQAQSAQQAAEAAKTGAESAQSAAAGSAQDAQQSATAAAKSAANVADKFISSAQATTLEPGSQATASVADQVLTLGVPKGEKGDKGDQGDKGDPGDVSAIQAAEGSGLSVSTDGSTVTIDDSALRERIAELENQAANVVTGTSTGLVAHAEDAYAQKPIELRVKGKTWVNRWPKINGATNGITVATDETGLVTVTGTATADADVTADVSGWAAGKSYTTMISATPTGCSAYFEVQKPSGNTSINATTTGATLNVASDATNCVAGVHVTSGSIVNASFRVMLVDGTEAPDCFTPPASITSVHPENLVTTGKSLLSSSTFAEDSIYRGVLNFSLPAGTYTLSCYNAEDWWTGNVNGSRWYIHDADNVGVATVAATVATVAMSSPSVGSRSSATFTLPRAGDFTLYTYKIGIAEMVTDLQLELGSTATAYEPPNVTTTPLPEVELRSLPNGTCDELVIKGDGTCEVERKTVQVTFDGSEDEDWVLMTADNGHGIANFRTNSGSYATSGASVMCDTLLVDNAMQANATSAGILMADKALYLRLPSTTADTVEELKTWLETNPTTVVFTNSLIGGTEPQSPVTLPTLPAPTFNQYHDSPVPSDTSTEYVRDINIVLDNLAKQVAGTASAVAVREASTIEEE